MSVPEVIQTATRVLSGQLDPSEAVATLEALTPDSIAGAQTMRVDEPEKADQFAELLMSIGRELRQRERESDQPTELKAVNDDLVAVYRALTGS